MSSFCIPTWPYGSIPVAALYQQIYLDFSALGKLQKHIPPGDERQAHLQFIFRAGNCLHTKIKCVYCSTEMVRHFAFTKNISVSLFTLCCPREGCMEKMLTKKSGAGLFPIDLRSLQYIPEEEGRAKAFEILKFATGLPDPLSHPREVYGFLRENYELTLALGSPPVVEHLLAQPQPALIAA